MTEMGDEMSNLLLVLAGSGKFVKHLQSSLAYAHEQQKFERKMTKDFFKPLRRERLEDAQLFAILAMAKAFVRLGNLKSLEEVLNYIIKVSSVNISTGPLALSSPD